LGKNFISQETGKESFCFRQITEKIPPEGPAKEQEGGGEIMGDKQGVREGGKTGKGPFCKQCETISRHQKGVLGFIIVPGTTGNHVTRRSPSLLKPNNRPIGGKVWKRGTEGVGSKRSRLG